MRLYRKKFENVSCSECIRGDRIEFIRIQQSDFAEIVGFGDFSIRADNHIAEPGAPHDGFVREVFINGNTVSNNG